MANRWYLPGLVAAEKQLVQWETADIRAILIDTGAYTVNTDTHEFLSSVPAGARVSTASITGRTVAAVAGIGAVHDATDVLFSAVVGPSVEAMIVYIHTGVDTTARLLFYVDTITGLPFTPNGGDWTIRWSDGNYKVTTFRNAA